MAGARVAGLIVCSDMSTKPVLVLRDVRRRWHRPPLSFCLVADIDNPTEQSFSWQVVVMRRGVEIDRTPETLEINSLSQVFIPTRLGVGDAQPRSYTVQWLLDGSVSATISLDFGDPEAAP